MTGGDQTIDLPGGDVLVLYGLSAAESDRGVIARLHPTRRRRWSVRPPAGGAEDAFVAMALDGDHVRGDTFQGQSLTIDVRTGALLGAAFVK